MVILLLFTVYWLLECYEEGFLIIIGHLKYQVTSWSICFIYRDQLRTGKFISSDHHVTRPSRPGSKIQSSRTGQKARPTLGTKKSTLSKPKLATAAGKRASELAPECFRDYLRKYYGTSTMIPSDDEVSLHSDTAVDYGLGFSSRWANSADRCQIFIRGIFKLSMFHSD